METPANPIVPDERVVALDVIRGFALLGILVMNMPSFSASMYASWTGGADWPAWWDQLALHVRDVLFDGKFNGLFSFLFAYGFTIQLARLSEREPSRAKTIYVRRLIALFAFGIAHACLLWTGDVLHMYALLGFALLVLRRASDGTLATLCVLSLLYPVITAAARTSDVGELDAM